MKSMNVGLSHPVDQDDIKKLDLVYPLTVEVENMTPRRFVFSSIGIDVLPHKKKEVLLKEESLLVGLAADIFAVSQMNEYEKSATLRFQSADDKKNSAISNDVDNTGDGGDDNSKSESKDPEKNAPEKAADDSKEAAKDTTSDNGSAGTSKDDKTKGKSSEPAKSATDTAKGGK